MCVCVYVLVMHGGGSEGYLNQFYLREKYPYLLMQLHTVIKQYKYPLLLSHGEGWGWDGRANVRGYDF